MKLGLAIAAAALVLDQVTKLYFYDLMVVGGRRAIRRKAWSRSPFARSACWAH